MSGDSMVPKSSRAATQLAPRSQAWMAVLQPRAHTFKRAVRGLMRSCTRCRHSLHSTRS